MKIWFAIVAVLAMGAFAFAPGARAQPYQETLLSNASASGQVQGVPAGDYLVWASGTFGGASVAISASAGGATGTLATLTGPTAGTTRVCVGAGEVLQPIVTGGSPTGLNLVLAGDGPCVPASSGGGSGGTVAQGAQAGSASGNTWFYQQLLGGSVLSASNTLPITIYQANAALSAGNGLPTTDTADGAPATAYSYPTGASGLLGELSDAVARLVIIVGKQPTLTASGAEPVAATTVPGTVGTDNSVNKPTLPNVGSNFGGTGPFANYVLAATIPANAARTSWYLNNFSGGQIVYVRDDGTAASGAAPANASVFILAAGSGIPSQGGSDSDPYFKGRIQIYTPAALTGNAFVTAGQE